MTAKTKTPEPVLYGFICEDAFSLLSPRAIDGYAYKTFGEAVAGAVQQIENGTSEVAIVRCRYSKRHDCYVEIVDSGCITIDASYAHQGGWFDEVDEEGDESSAPAAV